MALSHYICDFPGMSSPVGGRITIFYYCYCACPFRCEISRVFPFFFSSSFLVFFLVGGLRKTTTTRRCLGSWCARLCQLRSFESMYMVSSICLGVVCNSIFEGMSEWYN
ncbi:hypothetical protein V8C37DRAFT_370821 [Trichoderma ceciliae]